MRGLPQKVAFDAPNEEIGPSGAVQNTFDEVFHCRARYRFLRGGETVQSARLEGRQPVVVTIRRCVDALTIKTDWRMRDLHDGTEYAVVAVVPTEDRKWVEITAQSGGRP